MRGVGRQAQTVKLFPGANSHIRWTRIRTLLGQLSEPFFRALSLFLRKALGGTLYDMMCRGQWHMCERVTGLRTGYTSA